jgi:hypothetical protein
VTTGTKTTATKEPLFDRFASAVADFGSPFYAEERQRDVWNEASAFGLQLFLWGSLVLSAVMFWVGGRALLPYGAVLMLFASFVSYLMLAYVKRLGVDVPVKGALKGWRLVAFLVVYLANVLGALSAMDSGSTRTGFAAGTVIGIAGVAGLLFGQQLQRRRRDRADASRPGL